MKINVNVSTGARENKIVFKNNLYKVYLTEIPEKGKANQKLIKILSDHFDVSKSKISILRGEKSKNKLIEICDLKISETNKEKL